jgi:hypothetical protein
MLPSKALRILRSYAEVLGKTAWKALPLPESLLPHDKTAIKEAITVVVKLTEDDESAASALEDAYVHLADFVPDDVVARSREGGPPHGPPQVGPVSTPSRLRLMTEIRNRQEALLDEFRRLRGHS